LVSLRYARCRLASEERNPESIVADVERRRFSSFEDIHDRSW
jgi:hypothetical protein